MPQLLKDLAVEEVSLVDHPCCASTDPRTGRKTPRATVALWKRDPTVPTHTRLRLLADRCNAVGEQIAVLKADHEARRCEREAWLLKMSEKKEKRKMGFKKILKSAQDRDAVAAAVVQKAEKIAKRKGCSLAEAEADVWATKGATEGYESAPPAKPKPPERRMMEATESETELDRRARPAHAENRLHLREGLQRGIDE